MSKHYSAAEIIEVLSYMDEYSHSGQHREGAAIIRQLQAEIESLESECEHRVQLALIHGSDVNKKPLTENKIYKISDSAECNPDDRGWGRKFRILKFARAIEKAHGITGKESKK